MQTYGRAVFRRVSRRRGGLLQGGRMDRKRGRTKTGAQRRCRRIDRFENDGGRASGNAPQTAFRRPEAPARPLQKGTPRRLAGLRQKLGGGRGRKFCSFIIKTGLFLSCKHNIS